MLRVIFSLLFATALLGVAFSQPPATPLADLGGVVSPLDSMGDIIPGMSTVSSTADIELQRTVVGDPVDQRRSGVAHYDISGLNRDGVFSARLSGNIQNAAASSSGIRVEYIAGNGSVQASDADAPIVTRTTSTNRTFFSPTNAATTPYDFDVTSALREASLLGGSSLGVRYEAENLLGASIVTAMDPGTLVVDEYYADPFSSLQPIIGSTGFSFRGHTGEFVSQGQSELITESDYVLTTMLENNNSIRIDWTGTGALPSWHIDFAAPDAALLQAGDSFAATREGFQAPGVAGFAFSGDGRGNNTLAAEFTIHDIAYSGNEVSRLDASFTQWTVNNGGVSPVGQPKVFGRVLINATAVPEPSSVVAMILIATCFVVRRQKQKTTLAT